MLDLLDDLKKEFGNHELLNPYREMCWDAFSKVGFPTKKFEAYRDFPTEQLLHDLNTPKQEENTYTRESSFPSECDGSILAFINGRFSPSDSDLTALPKEVIIRPLSEALKDFQIYLDQRMTAFSRDETDPIALLNGAMMNDGVFIYIPPKLELKKPLGFFHISTTNHWTAPRIHLSLGKFAKAQAISFFDGEGAITDRLIDVNLEQGSHFSHVNDLCVPKSNWNFDAMRVQQKSHSRFENFAVTYGSKATRQDIHTVLLGEGAEVNLKGLNMVKPSLQSHAHLFIEHRAPHCVSNQHYKSVVADKGRSSFVGEIFVLPEAQKTEAYQLKNHLLLGERAIAHSRPNLEIFADDVKASHGATVAQLGGEELIYLKARGLSEALAKQLLVKGFCEEVVSSSLIADLPVRIEAFGNAFHA